jgi:hypothetical protein
MLGQSCNHPSPATGWDNVGDFIRSERDPTCDCWREIPGTRPPNIAISGWIVFGLAEIGAPATSARHLRPPGLDGVVTARLGFPSRTGAWCNWQRSQRSKRPLSESSKIRPLWASELPPGGRPKFGDVLAKQTMGLYPKVFRTVNLDLKSPLRSVIPQDPAVVAGRFFAQRIHRKLHRSDRWLLPQSHFAEQDRWTDHSDAYRERSRRRHRLSAGLPNSAEPDDDIDGHGTHCAGRSIALVAPAAPTFLNRAST